MVAIIRVNNKQYKVQDGGEVLVDRLQHEAGASVEGIEVLMMGEGEAAQIGNPVVAGAQVAATVVRHSNGPKIRVFKYKAKKNYRRRIGSRVHYTLLRIESITA